MTKYIQVDESLILFKVYRNRKTADKLFINFKDF